MPERIDGNPTRADNEIFTASGRKGRKRKVLMIMLFSLVIVIAVWGSTVFFNPAAEPEKTRKTVGSSKIIEYCENEGKLYGISALIPETDGRVTLVDDTKNQLWIQAETGRLKSVSLSFGDSFRLIDGHHVSITYSYVRQTDGHYIFMISDRFDARAFGGDINIFEKEASCGSYDDRPEK